MEIGDAVHRLLEQIEPAHPVAKRYEFQLAFFDSSFLLGVSDAQVFVALDKVA